MVVNALSRCYTLLATLDVRLLRFETLKDYYEDDVDFVDMFGKYAGGLNGEFMLQDEFFFKGNRQCVPKHAIRELISS